jgi:hypothetical protein
VGPVRSHTRFPNRPDQTARGSAHNRLVINAVSLGLIFTMLLAVVVLVLEKRSGITLDGEQYRGLLLIIFVILALSAYVVLEYFQHHSDEKAARVQARQRRKPKNQPAYAPIFTDNANTFAQVPHFRGPIDVGYRAMAQLHDPALGEAPQIGDMLREWSMQESLCEPPSRHPARARAQHLRQRGAGAPGRSTVYRYGLDLNTSGASWQVASLQ